MSDQAKSVRSLARRWAMLGGIVGLVVGSGLALYWHAHFQPGMGDSATLNSVYANAALFSIPFGLPLLVLLVLGKSPWAIAAYLVLAPTVNFAALGAIVGWIVRRIRRPRASA